MGKAHERTQQRVELQFIQIRDFAKNKHKTVDDTVCGGGAGMLLKPDVLFDAWTFAATGATQEESFDVASFRARPLAERPWTILLSPQGLLLTQDAAKAMVSSYRELIIVTGHYEGVDERFIDLCVDQELSIGDYVLTGGEYAAMVLADVLIRLVPGVVGDQASVLNDSLENGLLKAPQYTRPREFRGLTVPEVLLGGNHAAIEKWRLEQSLERTKRKRPDLWAKHKDLSQISPRK